MADEKRLPAVKKQIAGKDRPYTKLEAIIKGAGYTNTQVAHLAGIPISTLQTIIRPEADLGTVRVSNLLSLCRVLNITIEQLFDDQAPLTEDTDAPMGQRLELVTLFNRLNTKTRGELIGMMRSLAKDPNRLMVWPRDRE
ncbi:helix-turn-helix domain-containing protein [Collinsella aerofaciens]|uniref:helix-turn-helix domain-containing protein n=1 Tax=Collinsella aerofaciens TaxID=74426 RepID=UPI00232AEDEE|nr:helix-turn-helix transcriptional regulator [Collinsella aerofaciens]MDB1909150.1 helix-turn-helix transcriptional regulator [Collinsella aerofaciens]MDB1911035.1 helix-turn-helix transcriptional regulator [Collinsella aerofaciens]MDB1912939.1 helix-turn-helix transcriptional regulator [Collinsella aerofaciens]